jgi:eukaryotic-like serine/threonine-protein kinase
MANLEGHVLLNRYEILESVGRGGMADVYRALDRKRNQEVAIKVLREDLAEDPELRRRFQDEAVVLSKLTHKNIVRLYEFEEEGDLAFLVMDFINGTTLAKHLKNHRMSLGQALGILEQVCPALNYAHEEKYVHRDIKSSNIMIQNDGKMLLSDFGIAKVVEEEATGSTSLIGTAGYMSPEQILGKPLDQTTDIYSLGIVAVEMVTGRRPFVGDTDQTSGGTFERVRWQQVHQAAPPPSEFNPDLPREVDEAILQALRKKPAERPRSAMEFLSEFKAGCLAIGVNSENIEIDREKRTPPDRRDKKPLPPPSDKADKEKPRRNQRRVLAPLMILMAVLVCVVVSFALLKLIPVSSTPTYGLATQIGQNPQSTTIPVIAPTEAPKPTTALLPAPTPVPTNSPAPSPRPTTLPPTPIALTTDTTPAQTPTTRPTNTLAPSPIPPTPSGPEGMVQIPAGAFWMGAAEGDPAASVDEKPGMFLDTPAYWIDKFEVSVGQYKNCADAGKCDKPSNVWSPQNPNALFGNPNLAAVQDYPITFVSQGNASQYCLWAGKRLPYEYEWEKAARGPYEARIWPWGNTWDGYKANADQGQPGPSVVTKYSNPGDPQSYGCSVFGVCNMSGNVREWIADFYQSNWYKDGYRDVQSGTVGKAKPNWNNSPQMVIRGGSYKLDQANSRVSKRFSARPGDTMDDVGIRCTLDAK